MKSRFLGAVCACAVLTCLSASADVTYILDTGTPAVPGAGPSIGFGGQYLAGEFTISETQTVTSAGGYIGGGAVGDELTVAIYSNSNNNLPESKLFSATFATTDLSDPLTL